MNETLPPAVAAWQARVAAFDGCGLKQYATQPVYGDGNVRAKIVLIGEAPGAEEDKQGKPFVGRSGQLLDKLLAEVGLSRATNMYITNTTWWRPPANRTPTPAELAACRPLLLNLLEILQPGLLVAVGNTASKTLLQTKVGIMQLHGQWQPFAAGQGRVLPLLPVFHPAYLLRNPPATPTMRADLQVLRAKAQDLNLI
ncbi:MAG: uracil-DNA glycosylase [Alphaproteobacteria bacterium]